MILRSLRVQGWRCFADAVEVGPLSEGLNVIHGPNGSGKSTLLWALARGLFDPHGSSAADIKSIRPWGRSLSPQVEIDFQHDGVEYRIRKQFLESPVAELQRQENGQMARLAEGKNADEALRRLLQSESPTKRKSRTTHHWGFAQVLWATQGALHIEELSDGTRNTIHDSLGAQIAGPGGEAIEQLVAKRYGDIFTPTGKLKGGANAPPLTKLQEALDELAQRRATLTARLAAFDDASRRIEDLRSQQQQAEQQAAGLESKVQQAVEVSVRFDKLTSECQVLQEKEKNARIKFQQLKTKAEQIESLAERQHEQEATHKQLLEKSPAVEQQWQKCQAEIEAAKSGLRELRSIRDTVEQQERIARQARRFVDAATVVKKRQRQIEEVTAASGNCEELRAAISRVVAPDAATLKKIRKAARRRDDARLKLDAALIKVTLTPVRQLSLDVQQAEQTGPQTVDTGDAIEIHGAPEVAFEIEGIATIHATGPSESVDALRDELREAEAEVEELTADWGTQDLVQLESRSERAATLAGDLREAEARLKALLGEKTLADLQAELNQSQAVVDEILAAQAKWEQAPPDAATMARETEEARERAELDIRVGEGRLETAREAWERTQQAQLDLQGQLKTVEQQIKDTAEQLQTAQADGLDAAQRNTQLDDAALDWHGEKANLQKKSDELAALGDDPHSAVTTLQGQRKSLLEQAARAKENLIRAEAELQTVINEAPYSALSKVEEEIDRLQQDIAREKFAYDAIQLLHQTFAEQKRLAHEAVIEPVQQRANRTLRRIVGGRFESIQFDDSMLPTGVRPSAMDEDVVLDYLSGGEQEQVHFAVRLALADVAFGDQRQLLVLDDAFTATDTARLARVIKILEETAERFQVLVLSCHPERYQHLQDVAFFDLVELQQAAAAGVA